MSANDTLPTLARAQLYLVFTSAMHSIGMDPKAALIEKLQRHLELSYSEASGYVRIERPSDDGFAVELRDTGNQWIVYLGDAGFHEGLRPPTKS